VAFSVSPPVRYAALLGLLLAILGGGSMMLLGRGGGDEAATAHAINPHPFGTHAQKAATTPAAKSKTQRLKTTTPPVQKAPQPSAVVQAALAAGLPAPIATELGKRPVVVVSLYNPYSEVDGIAFAEARAGAKLAGVGFVPLNVLSQSQAGKLTEALGLLPDPGVLVYTRPGTLVGKLNGFADKETVAQLAQNAAAHGT
jgi:glucose/arabinose dehydrogenase